MTPEPHPEHTCRYCGHEPAREGTRRWTLEPYKDGQRWPRVRIDQDTPTVRVPIEVMPVSEHEDDVRALRRQLDASRKARGHAEDDDWSLRP